MLKNATTSMLVYTSQDPYYNGIGSFIRNSDCWINGVSNISCFSPAQLSGADWRLRAGTLITKKHVVFAKHFKPAILTGGTPLIFVDDNNNVIRRNYITITDDPYSDICVGLLDSEVPTSIKIAKVLPKNYQNYMGYPKDILVVSLNQNEEAVLRCWGGLLTSITQYATLKAFYIVPLTHPYDVPSNFVQYSSFTKDVINGGDSGNPSFIIINNELVIIGCQQAYTSGQFITDRYDTVNSIIESLSPGENYSLTDCDLAGLYSQLTS